MPKYKTKPVIIEAEQYNGEPVKGMCDNPRCFINLESSSAHVHTIHNNQPVHVEIGDYIIPEPNGVNFYPCKADIFENKYEISDEENLPAFDPADVKIVWLECNSSNVERYGYDPKLEVLGVEYKAGGIYYYPKFFLLEFAALVSAESKGSFISKNVRNREFVKIS